LSKRIVRRLSDKVGMNAKSRKVPTEQGGDIRPEGWVNTENDIQDAHQIGTTMRWLLSVTS
jgi:hypothetical protein